MICYRAIIIPSDEVPSYFHNVEVFFRGMNCPVELEPSFQDLHVPRIAKKLKIRQLGIGFCSFDWSKSCKDDNTLSGDFNPRRRGVLIFHSVDFFRGMNCSVELGSSFQDFQKS